ncbi:chorismate mutase [bacterium]|nr:chorismate mutase [bacterium]
MKDLRKQIDKIDSEILGLLNKRMETLLNYFNF